MFTVGKNFIVRKVPQRINGLPKADMVELKVGAALQIFVNTESSIEVTGVGVGKIEQWHYDLQGNGSIIVEFEQSDLMVEFRCARYTDYINTPMWNNWGARMVCR